MSAEDKQGRRCGLTCTDLTSPSTPKRSPSSITGQHKLQKAARIVQMWWRRYRAIGKTAVYLTTQASQLRQANEVLMLKSSTGFEDVLSKIRDKNIIASIACLLNAVSIQGPDKKRGSPGMEDSQQFFHRVQEQQARKILTAVMIKLHPGDVITTDPYTCSKDHGEEMGMAELEAQLVCIAANLVLDSASCLINMLGDLETGYTPFRRKAGALGLLRLRLNTLNFARTFMNASLTTLQNRQARSISLSFLTSYVEAYRNFKDAQRVGEEGLIEAARHSLHKVHVGICQVLGRELAEKHCRSVEEGMDTGRKNVVLMPWGMTVALPPMRMSSLSKAQIPSSSNDLAMVGLKSTSGNSYDISPGLGPEKRKSSTLPPRSEGGNENISTARRLMATTNSDAKAVENPPSAITQPTTAAKFEAETEDGETSIDTQPSSTMLLNEKLAHEIILNPTFSISEEKASMSAVRGEFGNEDLGHIRDTMEEIFWDRLVEAMTPPLQEGPSDFTSGSIAQIRFGSGQGSLFACKVEAVNEDETVDIEYLVDGVKERRPIHQFRLKDDPLEYEPFLALVDEVREKLTSLTPRRIDLAEELRAHLDKKLLSQMALQGLLDAPAIYKLLKYIFDHLMALQAPVRVAETMSWISGFEKEVHASMSASQHAKYIPSAFVALLPRVFRGIFARIDETQRDIADAHIQMLRPYLVQHGVEYEREKFAARFLTGQWRLLNTEAWLKKVLASPENASHLSSIAQGDAMAHRNLLSRAMKCLLQQPVRIEICSNLPETLRYDGLRMTKFRDEQDRITLVAVYSSLLRQFLSVQCPSLNSHQSECMGSTILALETRLYVLLQGVGNTVLLSCLMEEVLECARQICKKEEAVFSGAQASILQGMLHNAAKPKSPLFDLVSERISAVTNLYMCGEAQNAHKAMTCFGLASFQSKLEVTGYGLHRLFMHNLAVHGDVYSKILRDEASILLCEKDHGNSSLM